MICLSGYTIKKSIGWKWLYVPILGILIATAGCGATYPISCKMGEKADSPKKKIDLYTFCLEEEKLDSQQQVTIYLKRATAYRELLDYGSEARDLGEVIAIKPSSTNVYFNRGLALINAGNFDQAVSSYAVVAERNPDDYEAWLEIGRAHKKNEEYVKAIAALDKALALQPASIPATIFKADSLMRLKKKDEAIRVYSQLVEKYPDNADYQYYRGRGYVYLGDYAAAEKDFKSSIAQSEDKAERYYNIARVYAANKMYVQAADNYQTALKHNPNHIKSLQYYSWFLVRGNDVTLKNSKQALVLANRAVDITGGKDPQSLEVLAKAYAASGDFTNAALTQQQAIKIHLRRYNSGLYYSEKTIAGFYERYDSYEKGVIPPH